MAAPVTASRHRLEDLALGEEIGDGGEGTVFDVASHSAAGPSLVFKRYSVPVRGMRRRQLQRLVDLRGHRGLGLSVFSWPVSVVTDGDDLVGVLMPRAAAAFWASVRLRSGRVEVRLRESQYLLFGEDKLHRLGLDHPTLSQRLELLAGLVAAVEILHDADLVYGDISARNVLYSTQGHVGVFLLDCDGIVAAGEPYVIDSPDWRDPSQGPVATPHSDVHKLGLFASRILSVNPTRRTAPPIGGAPPALLTVIQAALDPDPMCRPSVIDLATVMATHTPGPPARGSGDLPQWGLARGTGDLVLVDPPPDPPDAGEAPAGRGWFRRVGT